MKRYIRLFTMFAIVSLSFLSVNAAEMNMHTTGAKMHAHLDGVKGKKMPKDFRSVPFEKAEILQDDVSKIYCRKCGMTLAKFYKTNHAATISGKVQQFCSMYCMVEAMNSDDIVTDPKVVDNTTLKFIDATKAFYVVGSSKPATMGADKSKYAFGTKKAAEAFAGKFGGKIMSYQKALAEARSEYNAVRKKNLMRQAMAAKKGKTIYDKMCKKITVKFSTVAEAKSYIAAHKSCGELKGKPLQMVGLYLKNL